MTNNLKAQYVVPSRELSHNILPAWEVKKKIIKIETQPFGRYFKRRK